MVKKILKNKLVEDADVLDQIEQLTHGMFDFWKNADGWAPDNAVDFLGASILEWQKSLSTSLRNWAGSTSDGDLILAWANLGALTEGAMKLLLSAYVMDYQKDDATPKHMNGQQISPDTLGMDKLRQYFTKKFWGNQPDLAAHVALVQNRRNAIHAFQKKENGTFVEYRTALSGHLALLHDLNDRLPYPEDVYKPRAL